MLRRLGDKNADCPLIVTQPLDDRRVYYQPTEAGAKLIGAPARVARPLGPISKINMYAAGWFLYVQNPGRRFRLRLDDFREQFHLVRDRLPRHGFYLDETRNPPRIGVILVDHKASVVHTVGKSASALEKFLRRGWFDDFIRGRRFVLTVLTSTAGKKSDIDSRLRLAIIDRVGERLLRFTDDVRQGLPVKLNVCVVPGLASLVPDEKNSEEHTQ
jgi:hypothetical protein